MSGSPKNIQRDGCWITPETALDLTFPAQTAMSATTVTVNAKTAVHSDKADAHAAAQQVTLSAANRECIGVYMEQPVGDNVPYRVKASAFIEGISMTGVPLEIVVGYAPATITGSGDTIEDPYYIPFCAEYDDMIMVPALESGDTYYGRALFIGISMVASVAVSAKYAQAHLSVQRLAVKPPTMQNAVS